MAFLARRTGHISSYSCPFDLVSSRIDSANCPLQNRVFGVQYIFWPKTPKMTVFFAVKRSEKRPKMAQKRTKKARKSVQNDDKTTPKWCQNDVKMIPKWPQNDPRSIQKCPKSPQNDWFWPIFGPFLTLFGPISGHFDPILAPKRLTMGEKGNK